MDQFIARVQAALTLLIVGAWVLLKFAGAFGYATNGEMMADDMKEVVMLAVGFWLLRPRASPSTLVEEDKPAPVPLSRERVVTLAPRQEEEPGAI